MVEWLGLGNLDEAQCGGVWICGAVTIFHDSWVRIDWLTFDLELRMNRSRRWDSYVL